MPSSSTVTSDTWRAPTLDELAAKYRWPVRRMTALIYCLRRDGFTEFGPPGSGGNREIGWTLELTRRDVRLIGFAVALFDVYGLSIDSSGRSLFAAAEWKQRFLTFAPDQSEEMAFVRSARWPAGQFLRATPAAIRHWCAAGVPFIALGGLADA